MTSLIQLFTGNQVQQSNTETLQPISIGQLEERIRTGSNGLDELCKQLRTILKMDKAAYGKHKLRLPFFCCATFEGNIRHSKNFRFVDSCVLDFDKVPDQETLQTKVLPAIQSDERVALAFTSPSGKGAKAILMLSSPVMSLQEYSQFYKNLVQSFAAQYGLEDYADMTTSDATRVCFLAHDPGVFFRSDAVPVGWQQYLPAGPLAFGGQADAGMGKTKSKEGSEGADFNSKGIPQKNKMQSLPAETYAQVVKRLNPTTVTKPPKELVVPEILEQVAVQAQAAIAAAGWQLKTLENIQYGKKIGAAQGFVWAEVNVFYGKRGFSIVRTPKSGTDAAMGVALEQLIWKTLQQPCEVDYGINPDASVTEGPN